MERVSLKKNITFALCIMALFGMLAALLIYNKPHRDIIAEKATYVLAVDQIYDEFALNQNAAYQKYNGQVIQIAGTIDQINSDTEPMNFVLIENRRIANCEMADELREKANLPKVEDLVVIKGLFIGFDDLLGELQLKKCTIVDN